MIKTEAWQVEFDFKFKIERGSPFAFFLQQLEFSKSVLLADCVTHFSSDLLSSETE